ncbi:tRNA (adenosine(37)-N6)-threonylcarbamoyltransferase complex ATPase subunit type 1 TsaE [Pseudorhodobacter aquimaris]|uniref:tRNA (adenosine(37)-N6)-threonylcarbamoyltransferase complex ATPase subunit type 1 TsaE n=1 Tax=Pseudorhodobacter aquimaris TaxID=687412 RepID=UPI00067A8107|nr:tRNA (adenosine(37)-N6)-threonylcarbamoyltransferase complex ATPase subunit type 1 TsaE [Pseudorhodobacter aquimaris]
MSADAILSLFLPDDAATTQLGKLLASYLQAGDVVLLSGSVGAGKTHLSRALIRQKLGRDEDIPSPTFTLVQTYEGAECEIWHADLYRLSHPDEALELGLDAAFETAICLVEWPDRLGGYVPPNALNIELRAADDGRMAQITGGRAGLVVQLKAGYDG